MIAFLLNIALMFVTGVLIVQALTTRAKIDLALTACLGVGLGVGAGSSVYFVLLNLFHSNASNALLIVELAAVVALVIINRRLKTSAPEQPASGSNEGPLAPQGFLSASATKWLKIVFGALFFLAAGSFVAQCWLHPHGNWDALMIWNVHARFLARAPENFQNTFSQLIFWSHPDYPLLLPAIISLGLSLTNESLIPPIALSFIYTMVTALLLVFALGSVRTIAHGLIAGIFLLTTPFWIDCGAMMYADVPIAFYFLATIVCCALYDKRQYAPYMVLAGMFAGLGTWTKNEGQLFIPCILLASAIAERRFKVSMKPILAALIGALPVLLLLVWFKFTLAPPNDVVAGQSISATTARLLDPSRMLIVAQFFLIFAVTFGGWIVSPIPLIAIFWFAFRSKQLNVDCRRALLTSVFLLLGYSLTYLVTPSDLPTHLKLSVYRLFLQVWPIILFAMLGSLNLESFTFAATPKKPKPNTQIP